MTSIMTHYEGISSMLTTGEVARIFKVHASTIRQWDEKGLIKAYRIGPNAQRRFRQEDVALAYLERAAREFGCAVSIFSV